MSEPTHLFKFYKKDKWRAFWQWRYIFCGSSLIFLLLYPSLFILEKRLIQPRVPLKSAQTNTAVDFSDLTSTLLYFGLMLALFALLKGVFMFFMRQTIIVSCLERLNLILKNEIYTHYQNSPDVSFYKQNRTGDLMARISEDVSRVRMFF